GDTVIAMPSPAGGTAVLETLNILSGFPVASYGQSSANHLHVLAESMKIAWADKVAYHGDPEYSDPHTAELLSASYADERRAEISMTEAKQYGPGDFSQSPAPSALPDHTSHISVIDSEGNAVAVTCSLGTLFGSGVVAKGTGFLLNNAFTSSPVEGPDVMEGGKRSGSNMTPTMVVRSGVPILVTGAAGGSSIIPGVVQQVVNTVDFGLDIADAIDAERINPTTYGTELGIEVPFDEDPGVQHPPLSQPRITKAVQDELIARGHVFNRRGEYDFQPVVASAAIDPLTGARSAVSDPRWTWGAFAQASD
ncbi:MAG: gamma-glutamyltransferase, partial [Candidatus Binatia bacterium]